MSGFLASLTAQHDARLAVIAVVVCALAAFTSISIYAHAVEDRRRTRHGWVFLTGVCAGSGMWATHLLGTLAYDMGVPTGYDPLLSGASLLVAMFAATVGAAVAVRGGRIEAAAGGAIFGAGIGLMHFIGKSALIVPGALKWDPALFSLSAAIGIALTSAAMIAFHELKRHWGIVAAASLLALAISGSHIGALSAVTVVPDPLAEPDLVAMADFTVAMAILCLTVPMSLAGLAATLIHTQSRRASRARSRELADAALEGLAFARDGVITRVNRQLAELIGCPADDLIGKRFLGDVITPPPGATRLAFGDRIDATLPTADGRTVPVGVISQPMTASSSANQVYVVRDMTVLRAREIELRNQSERFRAALANMSQGLAMFDRDERLVISNDRYAEMYGLKAEQVRPGMTLLDILRARVAVGTFCGADSEAYVQERLDTARRLAPVCRVQEMADGRVISVTVTPTADGGWVATHDDVTERRRIEARVEHLATHDTLTDLPNRVMFIERLEEAIAWTRKGDSRIAVFVVGLDRFVEINDAFGHTVGDTLLREMANRLRRCVPETGMVARIGGDEFAIMLAVTKAGIDAAAVAKKMQGTMTVPFELGEQHVAVLGSIGIAIAPDDGTEPTQILKNAALAMHRAKVERRGGYRFFEAEMDQAMQVRRNLERDLRLAIANGELELHYQPQVNLQRDEISGFEALLRWTHPQRGLVSPGEFIPIAEETGLIAPIGEWVLRQACAEAVKWPAHLIVSVNLSAAQFKGRNVTQAVLGALAATGLPPERLELEITETAMMQDAEGALAILTKLHERGVRLALDDFGTGYSSLSYLRKFPFDKIKIDRSFIHDLADTGQESTAIVRCIARLGDSLGMTTTAEGVETAEQLERVRAEGCTECQGYYFSAPMPSHELARRYFASAEKIHTAA